MKGLLLLILLFSYLTFFECKFIGCIKFIFCIENFFIVCCGLFLIFVLNLIILGLFNNVVCCDFLLEFRVYIIIFFLYFFIILFFFIL